MGKTFEKELKQNSNANELPKTEIQGTDSDSNGSLADCTQPDQLLITTIPHKQQYTVCGHSGGAAAQAFRSGSVIQTGSIPKQVHEGFDRGALQCASGLLSDV